MRQLTQLTVVQVLLSWPVHVQSLSHRQWLSVPSPIPESSATGFLLHPHACEGSCLPALSTKSPTNLLTLIPTTDMDLLRILLRRHGKRTQFDLSLTLKSRLDHVNGNGGYQSVTDVLELHVLAEKFLDGPGKCSLNAL